MIKVGLMGGVGNLLFQLARGASLAEAGHEVSFFHVAPRSKALYKRLGWTFLPQWLDIAALADGLGMHVGESGSLDYLRAGSVFAQRKLGWGSAAEGFDRPLDQVLAAPNALDLGYFQSPAHLSSSGMLRVLKALATVCGTLDPLPGVTLHLRGADIAMHERLKVAEIAAVLATVDIDLPVRVVGNDKAYAAKLKAADLRPLNFPDGTPFSDFCTIAASERLILSSSTFGFWAAALANAARPCPIHVQPGALFTRFPALFPHIEVFENPGVAAHADSAAEA